MSHPSSLAIKPRWFTQTLQDAQEQVGAPKTSFRVSHPPNKFPNYVSLMSSIIDARPSSFEEAAGQRVWQDAAAFFIYQPPKEYNSIMKNDVWELVPRPEGKSVIYSRWLYKVKHAADGSIEK